MQTLTRAEVSRKAPSVFATQPHADVSDRYAFIPTARVMETLEEKGWQPVKAEQSYVRKADRRGFQKHLLRFRHPDLAPIATGRVSAYSTAETIFPEIVLTNSHDCSCSFQFMAGLFRMVCSNGLIVADATFDAIRVRHVGFQNFAVLQAADRIAAAVPQLGEAVRCMRGVTLEQPQALAFAERVLKARWPENAPVTPGALLSVRRMEDTGKDLFTRLNVVQENLMRGGLLGRDARGSYRRTRGVNSVSSSVALNRAVWNVASEFAAAA